MPLQITEALDNLYTTTWELRRKELVNQIFYSTPLWYWLSAKGRMRTERGGRFITESLEYGKNDTVRAFGRGATFTLADPELLTTAIFDWKYVGGSIVRYYVDDQKNAGKAQIINLLEAKLDNLRRSMVNRLEEYVFGDGTADGGLAPEGLQKIIRDTAPTGTGQDVVGGIDAYTYTWWQSARKAASGPFSTFGVSDMRNLFNTLSDGADAPDFIITTQEVFEAYEDELLDVYRIVDKTLADAGFQNLAFKGRPITWARKCPTNKMYFINSKYLQWVADESANFEMTEWKPVQNSLDRAAQVVVVGNLTVRRRNMLGVYTAQLA